MKILVVDDSQTSRELIIAHLKEVPDQKFQIVQATNGREAVSLFNEQKPDIMLLDYVLPDINGIEVVKELTVSHPILPIIMVTGLDDIQLAVDATQLGVLGYLLKDRVSPDTLLWTIQSVLLKVKMQKQILAQQKELEHFAYTVAHDLKDQIGAMQGIMNLIKTHDDIPEQIEYLVSIGIRAGDQMQDFVEELLGYAVLQKEAPEKTTVKFNALMDEMSIKLQHLIEKNGTTIIYNNLPEVYGAYTLIYQVTQNLLTNAMSYAGENLTIEITAEEKKNNCTICIKDNGKGISKDEQHKIFDMFQRGSTASDKQGTGIGLATCKRIIEDIHDGKLWVKSDIGEGTSFCFTLPKQNDD